MSHKTSPARRAAFFAALAETGNQTISAERARVSRSWVSLHRASDPAFRAQLDAAIATARARLQTEAAGVKPAAGWGHQAGEELVVRGSRGRLTQIARARLKQWTPRAEGRFCATLGQTCNVKAACRAAGLSVASAYNHYHRWPDFAKRWEAALASGYDRLELALIENAIRSFGPEPDYPPDIAIGPMSFEDALRVLRLNTARVHGGRVRRGYDPRPPMTDEQVTAELMKRLEAKGRELRGRAEEASQAGAPRE